MTMRQESNRRPVLITLVVAAMALGVGCGGGGSTLGSGGGRSGGASGGSSGGESSSAAVSDTGAVITDSSGNAVNQGAHRAWTTGIAKYNEYETSGWNSSRCSDVIDLFDEANREQGGNLAEALYMQGMVHRRCDHTADARRFFDRALAATPTYCQARVGLGLLQLEAGDRPAARQTFQKALDDDANCMSAYVNIAMIQAETPAQVETALISLSSALALDSDYLPAFNELAMVYFRSGTRTNDSGMVDLAHIVCEQATMITGGSEYAPIYNTWGLIRLRRDDINEALRFFQRARTLDDRIYEAQINFANITFQFRGYQDAFDAYHRATELQPNSYDAAVGLGAALRGLQRFPEAQAQYERAIQIDANRPEAYFNLGQLYQSYMSSSEADLARSRGYYTQFLAKAGTTAAYAPAVADTTRTCSRQPANRRRRRMGSSCRPGYVQLIDDTITMMRAQSEMDRMNSEQEQQEAQTPPSP